LIKKVFGVSLDELGVSLINIRSTGFENVAVLFHDQRIRKRCAIVTDLDDAFIDTAPDPLDGDDEKLANPAHLNPAREWVEAGSSVICASRSKRRKRISALFLSRRTHLQRPPGHEC